jgi:hypothetical protein
MLYFNETSRGSIGGVLSADVLDRLGLAEDRTGPDISPRACALSLALLLLVAAALQTGLLLSGLYSLSADESARTLLAHRTTLSNAFDPFIWPPLGTILNSLALALHDDLFLTPRLLVSAFGLAGVLAVAFVTHGLFGNRLMAVVGGALALLVPHRLLLSVAPLSDIFGTVPVLFAAGFLILWLRKDRPQDLLAVSILLFFAAMTRYELWFFNVVLGLYLAYRSLIRRDLGFGLLVLNGAILSVFPIFWILRIYLYNGNLDIFSLTSRQFIDVNGRNYLAALRGNVLVDLIHDIALNPVLIVGACMLAFLVRQREAVRDWVLLLALPLAILAAQMAVSLGVPMAASFRIDETWVLLLLPFAAFGLVLAAEKMTPDGTWRYAVLALATYIAIVPFGLQSHSLAKGLQTNSVLSGEDLALGRYLRAQAADGKNFLLDSLGTLDYMNIPVAANMPDRFVLNVDEEPVTVGIYLDARKTYEAEGRRDIIARYLTDKFGLSGGLDLQKLKARNIGHLIVQCPQFIAALDANPQVARRISFGSWVVYDLRG